MSGKDFEPSLWNIISFGATREQIQGFVMISWRAAVVFHIMWICGWLGFIGLHSPFVTKAEAADMKSQIKMLTDASKVTTKLSLVREIRLQTELMCELTDRRARGLIQNTIDKLREDYKTITGETYPEVKCPQGGTHAPIQR